VRKREAILVALLVTAFWALIFVLTSNASIPYEICEATKEGAKEGTKECARYNIISFALREIGAHLDIVSALITAVATAFIARYTFTLKRSTDKLWDAGERQIVVARETAEAAKLNANALISAERAQLFVIVQHSNLFDVLRGPRFYRETESMNGAFIPRAELEFVIRNTGRTAAILQDVSYQLVQADAETTMWQYSYRDTIVNAVIEGENETSPATPCVMENQLTLDDGIAVIDGERPLYFYGFVIFRDTFKNRHQYFWRHEYRGNRFVLVHEEEQPAQI
jgi:hypothetical protein